MKVSSTGQVASPTFLSQQVNLNYTTLGSREGTLRPQGPRENGKGVRQVAQGLLSPIRAVLTRLDQEAYWGAGWTEGSKKRKNLCMVDKWTRELRYEILEQEGRCV